MHLRQPPPRTRSPCRSLKRPRRRYRHCKRKQLAPTLRAICKTEHAIAVMVNWVRSNGLTFATRCGGHSYEGLSQTTGVAIDVRGLKQIAVDKASELVP